MQKDKKKYTKKEEITLSLFTEDMNIYVENMKEKKILQELIDN